MSTRVEIDREALTITGERSIRDAGNSAALTIPPEILQGTGLEQGDKVVLEADMEEGTIVVKRAPDEDEGENEGEAGDE